MKQENNLLNNIIFLLLQNIFSFWDLPFRPGDYEIKKQKGNKITLFYSGRVKLTVKIVVDINTQTVIEYNVKIN